MAMKAALLFLHVCLSVVVLLYFFLDFEPHMPSIKVVSGAVQNFLHYTYDTNNKYESLDGSYSNRELFYHLHKMNSQLEELRWEFLNRSDSQYNQSLLDSYLHTKVKISSKDMAKYWAKMNSMNEHYGIKTVSFNCSLDRNENTEETGVEQCGRLITLHHFDWSVDIAVCSLHRKLEGCQEQNELNQTFEHLECKYILLLFPFIHI